MSEIAGTVAAPTGGVRGASERVEPLSRQGLLGRADAMLRAVEPWWSPSRARLDLPGPASASGRWSDGLEGFARTFLLAAMRISGERGSDPDGLLERYAAGLTAGVDPQHPERWPRMSERRQARVEAASIAIALSETRPWLWDRLPARVQQQCVDWFAEIVGTTDYRNNWLWFQDVVETFLASVGGPWDAADLARNEELREQLYVGDGWYSDGRGRDGERQSFDYYAGWAWHVYPLLVSRMRGEPLAPHHAERLHSFVGQYAALLASDGAPVLQGRSVTYRYAVLAPFWAARLVGVSPLSAGQTRDLAGAVLRSFGEDAGQHPGADPLSIGWHRPFPGVRQLYTGPASPYWASKGMLGLLLPESDEVWRAEPDPTWFVAGTRDLPVPGWIISGTPDGVTRLVNHGSDRQQQPRMSARADDPFYLRLGYSSVAGPSLLGAGVLDPVEQHVAVLDGAGRASHRDAIERVAQAAGGAASASWTHWLDVPGADADVSGWSSLRRGPRLLVASLVHGASEVRLAVVIGPAVEDSELAGGWPVAPEPLTGWRVRCGGWALAAGEPPREVASGDDDAVAVADTSGLTSRVRLLSGPTAGSGVVHRVDDNAFGRCSATPYAQALAPLGEALWFEVVLTRDGEVPAVASWSLSRGVATVAWADGHVVELDLTDVVGGAGSATA